MELARRFTSITLAPIVLATIAAFGRQISIFFAAIILSPVARATVFSFHYLITSFSSATGSRKLPPASQLFNHFTFAENGRSLHC
jgi:hypothetical protein